MNKWAELALVLGVYLLVVAAAVLAIDNRHPEVYLRGNAVDTVEYGETYHDPGAVAYSVGRIFGYGRKELTLYGEGTVDTSRLGDYTLTYAAAILYRTESVSRTVRVVDTTPPVLELQHREGQLTSWLSGYQEEGYTAFDAVDGDLTDQVERTPLPDKVIYRVTDSSGNETVVERVIEYDVNEPLLTLNGGEELTLTAAMSFTDPGFTAVDGLGNDLSEHVTVSGEVIPYAVGSYELDYTIESETGETISAHRTVNIVPAERVQSGATGQKTIYLTFDDGPGPYTAGLLNLLDRYGVKATFFVTGLNSDYEDMIGRAYERGHSIGVHSYSHDYYKIYASEQAYFDDFMAMEDIIYRQTGSYTKLFRFPGGSSNTVSRFNSGIMSRLAAYMTDMGYYYFDWNVSSGDAGETTKTSRVLENVTEGCKGMTTCVVLQHDIKDFSVDAVEDIILWGVENGYRFAALDESSYGSHHGIAN